MSTGFFKYACQDDLPLQACYNDSSLRKPISTPLYSLQPSGNHCVPIFS